jgi:hypothetical protein
MRRSDEIRALATPFHTHRELKAEFLYTVAERQLAVFLCTSIANSPLRHRFPGSNKAISRPSFAHHEGFPLAGLIGDQLYFGGVVPGDIEHLL